MRLKPAFIHQIRSHCNQFGFLLQMRNKFVPFSSMKIQTSFFFFFILLCIKAFPLKNVLRLLKDACGNWKGVRVQRMMKNILICSTVEVLFVGCVLGLSWGTGSFPLGKADCRLFIGRADFSDCNGLFISIQKYKDGQQTTEQWLW